MSVDGRRLSCDSESTSRVATQLQSPTVASHPSMEGLVSFVAPELTERTLMHVSHVSVSFYLHSQSMSVCLSVCHMLLKWLNLGYWSFHSTVAQ